MAKIELVVRQISGFVRFGGKMRPPSWILRKTGTGMCFGVRTIVYKLQFKLGEDRTYRSADIGFCSFWRENASAILSFGELEPGCFFGSGPLFASYSSNLVKIGHVVRQISGFVRFGAKMRPPSRIFEELEPGCIFGSGTLFTS